MPPTRAQNWNNNRGEAMTLQNGRAVRAPTPSGQTPGIVPLSANPTGAPGVGMPGLPPGIGGGDLRPFLGGPQSIGSAMVPDSISLGQAQAASGGGMGFNNAGGSPGGVPGDTMLNGPAPQFAPNPNNGQAGSGGGSMFNLPGAGISLSTPQNGQAGMGGDYTFKNPGDISTAIQGIRNQLGIQPSGGVSGAGSGGAPSVGGIPGPGPRPVPMTPGPGGPGINSGASSGWSPAAGSGGSPSKPGAGVMSPGAYTPGPAPPMTGPGGISMGPQKPGTQFQPNPASRPIPMQPKPVAPGAGIQPPPNPYSQLLQQRMNPSVAAGNSGRTAY